jgi:hypothetical protein
MSLSMHEKITIAEAHEWLKAAAGSWKDGGIPEGEEEFLEAITELKPVDFKPPKKPRATKKSSPPSERAVMEYDDTKCGARIWLTGGFAAQCSCKHVCGKFLCKKHQTESDKNGDMVSNGFFNAEKPTHKYNDESNEVCWWSDQLEEWEKNKKPVASKKVTSSKRKCSCCKQEGHTKAKCPHKISDVEAARAVLAAAEEKAAEEKAAEEKSAEEKAGDMEQEPEPEPEPEPEAEPDAEVEAEAEAEAEPEAEVEVEAEVEAEPEAEVEPEPEAEAEEELDTDKSDKNSIDCTLDGVYYFRDTDGDVYDDDYDKVGKWGGSEIVFDNEKTHRMAVKQL